MTDKGERGVRPTRGRLLVSPTPRGLCNGVRLPGGPDGLPGVSTATIGPEVGPVQTRLLDGGPLIGETPGVPTSKS